MGDCSTKPHVALLPGLDGTGQLFQQIVPFLEDLFSLTVVQYQDQDTFEGLVKCAEEQLPQNAPISLVAESFSSPIAIEILAKKKLNYEASVLSTGFCRSPLKSLTSFIGLVPNSLFGIDGLSKLALEIFGIDKESNGDLSQKCIEALGNVAPSTIKRRIEIVRNVDVCDQLSKIDVSVLYIRATRDRIVPKSKSDEVISKLKNAKEIAVKGPHLILHSKPDICAEHIIEHMTSNKRMQSDKPTATPLTDR